MNSFRFLCDPDAPRNIFSLNGSWDVAHGGVGAPAGPPRAIEVPSVLDPRELGPGGPDNAYAWYSCNIEVQGVPPTSAVWLKIEQAQFGTAVFLDGVPLGSSMACYTSQEYRLDAVLRTGKVHRLEIRVGCRETLPPESAVGRDQEKSVFTPGIWGDVWLVCAGMPRIEAVQVIPRLKPSQAAVRVWLDSGPARVRSAELFVEVRAFRNAERSVDRRAQIELGEGGSASAECVVPMEGCRVWSPDDPFLYTATVTLFCGGRATDRVTTRFGMREFTIRGNAFLLNGKRIFLKGGNIAFHRFLADPERKRLPWDPAWIKRLLVDIPRAHHFNFFRLHLGHAYNRWYDIADEHGMLLQDEWAFWCVTGSNRVIEEEMRQWLRDNWNHPSIVIWDPINECSDASLLHDVVPALRELDPTRPWEAVDFQEQHPYIYSLGMTLPDRRFGFTDALRSLENSSRPVVVNEFIWWWLDNAGRPTELMKDVVERWLGPNPSGEQLLRRQEYLVQELVGLFRRMRCAAIQPFVYLSNSDGPTGHWFEGAIAQLHPKPILTALKNAFAPFGFSCAMWDRHFEGGEAVDAPLHVFNDTGIRERGVIAAALVDELGNAVQEHRRDVEVAPGDREIVSLRMTMPTREGAWGLRMSLEAGGETVAAAEKTLFVLIDGNSHAPSRPPVLIDPLGEVAEHLMVNRIPHRLLTPDAPLEEGVLFVNTFGLERAEYRRMLDRITEFLDAGGTVVVQEPEFRATDPKELAVSHRLSLRIERRQDTDRGGYDTYVFPKDPVHPLFRGIPATYLQWFNGAFGGEIVSEHTVLPSLPQKVLASCGLGLRIPAVLEVGHGAGRVIVSRIQVRGRLLRTGGRGAPYQRRYDPVAVRYLHNLLSL